MVRVEHEVFVERSPDEVFAYISEPENVPEWQSGVIELRRESEEPMGPGARWTEVRTFLGRRFESTVETTVYEPGKEFSLRVVSGPFPFQVRHLFEPADAGTRITVVGEGEAGRLFKLGVCFAARTAGRVFGNGFAKLKEVVDTRT